MRAWTVGLVLFLHLRFRDHMHITLSDGMPGSQPTRAPLQAPPIAQPTTTMGTFSTSTRSFRLFRPKAPDPSRFALLSCFSPIYVHLQLASLRVQSLLIPVPMYVPTDGIKSIHTGLGSSNTASRRSLGGIGQRRRGLSGGGEESSVGASVAQGTAALASEARGTASDEDHFEREKMWFRLEREGRRNEVEGEVRCDCCKVV